VGNWQKNFRKIIHTTGSFIDFLKDFIVNESLATAKLLNLKFRFLLKDKYFAHVVVYNAMKDDKCALIANFGYNLTEPKNKLLKQLFAILDATTSQSWNFLRYENAIKTV